MSTELLKDELKKRPVPPVVELAVAPPRRFIDLIPHPACVIDTARHVHELNPRAEALLKSGEPICLRAGRLHCHAADALSELERYLEREPSEAVLSLRFGRKAPGRDMLMRVERSAITCTTCHGNAVRFLVHLFVPTDHWSIPEDVLRAVYRLTPGEARVIHLLLKGSRVTAVARELTLSPETVRTHLKHVMRKLEVSTQMQLIQVLASGPWR